MISDLLRQVGYVIVLMVLIGWGYQLMAMHIDFGQRLADQATGALFYALNVRNPCRRVNRRLCTASPSQPLRPSWKPGVRPRPRLPSALWTRPGSSSRRGTTAARLTIIVTLSQLNPYCGGSPAPKAPSTEGPPPALRIWSTLSGAGGSKSFKGNFRMDRSRQIPLLSDIVDFQTSVPPHPAARRPLPQLVDVTSMHVSLSSTLVTVWAFRHKLSNQRTQSQPQSTA
jgi:hypothetical protein